MMHVDPALQKYHQQKIRSFESQGNKHQYDYEWRPWTGNGYIKAHYDALLEDGTLVTHCWPNGGHLCRGEHHISGQDGAKARLSTTSPY